ncbi:F-box/kelch-repeat protein At3g06240-like [Lycium barbarum]|uniref:F-box/kelch-repeat protein At3g06240-like n=1 Tax=Lycium barbarum TaxID=112863 RepID=UPI00293E7EA7|nr:F-box/kelch-repeat protein At3g06240-like [Lycium barbarum]
MEEQRIKLLDDVMIDISKRLPAKSLIRFKCVSKSWCTMINSPDFISIHYNYDSLSNHFIFRKRYLKIKKSTESIYYNGKNMLSLHSNNESFECIAPNIEYLDNYIGVDIAGPCNGIVCFASYRGIILYNPTLREFWELPSSILPPPPHLYPSNKLNYCMSMTIGIGFDPQMNDYMVVRVLDSCYEYEFEDFDNCDKYKHISKVKFYNLSTNYWRELENLEYKTDSSLCSHVLFNRAYDWHGYLKSYDSCIVSFNFSTKKFQKLPFPDGLVNEGRQSLFVLNQTLALICFTENYLRDVLLHQSIDIWVMKKYGVRESWIKEFTVGPMLIKAPLSVWKKDTELMIKSEDGKLVSCHLLSQ